MSTWNAPPNWPQPEPGWRPPPGWKPDPAWGPAPEGWQFERGEGTGPQGKAGGGGFLRKKGVQLAGAGLAGLLLGSIIGGSGGSGGDDTATTAAEGADPAEVTELQRQLAVANKRVQDAEAAAKAQPPAPAAPVAPAAPPPPPPPPPAAPPPAAAGLKDGSFSSANPILKEQLGTFGGTARVTNTSGKNVQGALVTYTLFKGGAQVATMQGSVSNVAAGQTQTVQLISSDKFVSGVDKFEFQVDTEF